MPTPHQKTVVNRIQDQSVWQDHAQMDNAVLPNPIVPDSS
ncbi:hypothetical protein J715_2267 [Acinetobacter baumannii 1571545]|nr:hypothetical protein J715_2267 [Acinetobacter baumannii 1571545]